MNMDLANAMRAATQLTRAQKLMERVSFKARCRAEVWPPHTSARTGD